MSKDSVFMSSRRVCSDDCAKEARDTQNDGIYSYSMYHFQPVACKDPQASVPAFSYDHVNLRGRVGYGLAEDCVVDRYSSLRNDPAALTRDRCRTQLFSRIFQGCPNLKPGVPNPDAEMPIMQGISSKDVEGVQYVCKKTIMEKQTYTPIPLVNCMQDIQDPNHIVEPWVRGGEATRDFVRRQELLDSCGMSFDANRAQRRVGGVM
jgi:hypothetical protein